MFVANAECSTCGSRLRVRNRELLGQIVTCPKCGGMVQLPNDSGQFAPGSERVEVGGEGDADSHALTQGSISDADIPGVDGSPPPAATGPVFEREGVPAVPPVQHESRMEVARFVESADSQRKRQLALIVSISTASLLAAVFSFVFFVRWWQVSDSAITTAANVTPINEIGLELEGAATESTIVAPPAEETPARSVDDSPQPDDGTPLAATKTETVAGGEAETGDALEADMGDAVKTEVGDAAKTEMVDATAATTADATPGDVDELAMQLLHNPLREPIQDSEGDQETGSITDLPEEMKRFTQILSFDQPVERSDLPVPPTIERIDIDFPDEDGEGIEEPVESIDVERLLGRTIALDPKPASLLRWSNLLGQITGVPVGIDIVTCDAAGISIQTAVTPPSGWLSCGEILRVLAGQAGLTTRVNETMVILEAPPAEIEQGIAPGLRIGDLDEGSDDASERLHAAVWRLSQAEQVERNEQGRMQIEGSLESQWWGVLTLEAFRLARQQELRLDRQRTQRWLVTPDDVDWPPLEGGETIDPFDRPLPVMDLIQRLARQNQAEVLIHWPDALVRGLSPVKQAMPWLREVTAEAAVDEMLEPFALEARQMAPGLWWVGAAWTYEQAEVIVVAKLQPDQRGLLMDRLVATVGLETADELPIVFDDASDSVLLRGPRFVVRQLHKFLAPANR